MSVPVSVMLDVPEWVLKGLANGTLIRNGSVVRAADNGRIVLHLVEVGSVARQGAGSLVKWVPRVGRSATAAVVVSVTVGLAVGGMVVNGMVGRRRRESELGAALKAYLEAAQAGTLTMDMVERLSLAISQVRAGGHGDSVDIADGVAQLVQDYTAALAAATGAMWELEEATDVPPLQVLEQSLAAQREILDRVE